jgi:hypothetical protein
MLTRDAHLLSILAEECCEVGQRVSKALRFGLEEVQKHAGANPEQLDNANRIMQEFCDLLGAMEKLHEEGVLPLWPEQEMMDRIRAKKEKIDKYLSIAQDAGALVLS